MPDVATPAAESSTAAPQTETAALEVPRDGEAYAQWRLTGKLPEAAAPKITTPKEDSTPSKTSVSETASEAGTDKQGKKPKERDNAADRLKELLDDLKQAGYTPAELKTLRKQAAAESAKAPEPPKGPEPPKKPKQDDFETYDKYEEAVDKWHEAVADYRAELKIQERDRRRAQEESQRATNEKLEAAEKRYGAEAKTTIQAAAKEIFDNQQIAGVVKALISDSPVIADLLYVMGSKGDDLKEFVQLAKTHPGQAIRKAVLLERLVTEELAKTSKTEAGGSEGTGRNESGQFTKPPAKKVTEAPPPPKETGGRQAAPPDEVERAVTAKDFTAYRNEQNRRDLARRQGR
jgi:hypothetical protein